MNTSIVQLTSATVIGQMYKRLTERVIKQINPELFVEQAVRVESNK